MSDGFVQARPNGDHRNLLFLMENDLVEITPASATTENAIALARNLGTRFYFKWVHNLDTDQIELACHDIRDARNPSGLATMIFPARRVPTKDAAIMWAIHRGAH